MDKRQVWIVYEEKERKGDKARETRQEKVSSFPLGLCCVKERTRTENEPKSY